MKPAPVQPSLFDPPKGDCPQCDGTGTYVPVWPEGGLPHGEHPYDYGYGPDEPALPCPNCGGSGSPDIPF